MPLCIRENHLLSVLVMSQLFSATTVLAYENYEDYLDALRIADRQVQKKKALENARSATVSALSSAASTLTGLYGKTFEPGDTWDVAAVRIESSMARKLSDQDLLREKVSAPGVFRYRVTKVGTEVVIEITQLDAFGAKPVDAKIKNITLTLAPTLISKKYTMQNSTENVTRTSSALERFPLDALDVSAAERMTPTAVPELPAPLQKTAQDAGWRPDLSRSTFFEHEDSFGRPIQVLWQKGDPWPTWLKTPYGVAILVRKGN